MASIEHEDYIFRRRYDIVRDWLSPRERLIIDMNLGIKYKVHSIKEIANKLNLSRERIYQIKNKARQKVMKTDIKRDCMGIVCDPLKTMEDLTELDKMLTAEKIPHTIRTHPLVKLEHSVIDIIGYYPTGPHQIIVKGKYSIIRGACSFGWYELFCIKGNSDMFDQPERFDNPKELINKLKEELYGRQRKKVIK